MKRMAFLSIVILAFVAVSYQNCGKGFQANIGSSDSLSLSSVSRLGTAKTAGVFDSSCLQNATYDACVFWKNPVAQRGSVYTTPLSFGMKLNSEQTFGVQIENLINPNQLKSKSLDVYYSGADFTKENRLVLNNGQFRQDYSLDGSATDQGGSFKSIAQLMAYFWLNHLEVDLKKRTGVSYSENNLTLVDAYAADESVSSFLEDNAFFAYGVDESDRMIVMGYATRPSGTESVKAHEIALSAEVYIHEMGHANFYAAKGNKAAGVTDSLSRTYYYITKCSSDPSYTTDYNKNIGILTDAKETELQSVCDPNGNNGFQYATFDVCPNNQGCLTALNEGQADFHSLMIFPDSPGLGETANNSLSGGFGTRPRLARRLISGTTYQCVNQFVSPGISRNAALNVPLTVEQIFQGSTIQANQCSNEIPGEVHGMGSAYASILWEIYSHPQIEVKTFEKAFQAHLQKLSSSSNFSTAWMALRADYLAAGGNSEGQKIIDQIFTRKGVVKPASL